MHDQILLIDAIVCQVQGFTTIQVEGDSKENSGK